MARRTPLFEVHRSLHARFVDFGGWEMPLHYSSQIAEHHAVRRSAGVFDVSHMCVIDLEGAAVRTFLRRLLANDIDRLQQAGRALYSCMLNEQAGILDDLIAYCLDANRFRLVVNAGTRDKDLGWIREHAPRGLTLSERTDLALLAVQGPQARARVATLLAPAHATTALSLATFSGAQLDSWWVARTGYTGEDGFELMLPASEAEAVWRKLLDLEVTPCGLGARDTLRLEAGMNLYGLDMDEMTDPFESGLGWTVDLKAVSRDFIGRTALEQLRRQPPEARRVQVGLVLEDRGVLRAHQPVHLDDGAQGQITSGTFSPTLERSIAFARVPARHGAAVRVDIRGRLLPARIVKTPFVRFGKSLLQQPEEAQ